MADQRITLRHVLTQAKSPLPSIKRSYPLCNTHNREWPKLRNFAIWDEFNLNTLNDSYGHILNLSIPDQLAPRAEEMLSNITIATPNDMLQLINWNNEVIDGPVQFAKSKLGLQPSFMFRQRYRTVEASMPVRLFGSTKIIVDHIIRINEYPEKNLVVGIGRLSRLWNVRRLANEIPSPQDGDVWPLRQLANICRAAKTRYGYIQTEEDLVVCCFSQSNEQWRVKLMVIPWTNRGVHALTTDLALWWLCMLAMSRPEHRAILSEDEMVGINEWDIIRLDEHQGWVRRHRYSNFEERIPPPPPPSYYTPSPGNTAALAAGISAQDLEWEYEIEEDENEEDGNEEDGNEEDGNEEDGNEDGNEEDEIEEDETDASNF
ncbi:hypothetical protein E4U54_007140 [Claviceps lovelessii]|nr:hypothetical protein E4U54_007140 [Claviceps lovelessii]